ncbi:MAG: hypothetical protein LBD58_01070 [Treponema sp.]|nr:hypothetical protein [Treponema sp.]
MKVIMAFFKMISVADGIRLGTRQRLLAHFPRFARRFVYAALPPSLTIPPPPPRGL